MNTHRNSFAALNAIVGFDVAATAKANARDCRLGHCGHRECEEAADRRFAASGLGIDDAEVELTAAEIDEQNAWGLELALELRKECALGICHHAECQRKVSRRIAAANRRETPVLGTFPGYSFRPDGSIDKAKMRQERFFGASN